MDEFRSRVASLWRSSGAAISCMAGPFKVVEGTYQPVRLAMPEFPTMDQMCLAATVSHGFFMTGA